jgi:hypothetical protein
MRTILIMVILLITMITNEGYSGDTLKGQFNNGRLEGKGITLELMNGRGSNTKVVNTKYGSLVKFKKKTGYTRLKGKGHLSTDLRARHNDAFKK